MSQKNLIIIAVVVVLLLVGGSIFAFMNKGATTSSSSSSSSSSSQVSSAALASVASTAMSAGQTTSTAQSTVASAASSAAASQGVVNYSIEISNYKFAPAELQAKPGQTLHLTIMDKAGSHDFVAPALNISSGIFTPGETKVIDVVIPQNAASEYEFFCSVSGHKEMGMKGKIVVAVG
jgi:plastocyanin